MSRLEELHAAIAALPIRCGDVLRMQDLIDPVIRALPELLANRGNWSSVYIDYEPPFLMRIALPVTSPGDGKRIHVALHYFFGMPGSGASDAGGLENPYAGRPQLLQQESANNYHPHPWAAAFHLFEGSYRQRIGRANSVGYSADPASALRPVPHDEWAQDSKREDAARYAFNDKLIWHQVLPNDGAAVTSLMITYIPEDWDQIGPKPAQKQRVLNEPELTFMFDHFTSLLQPARAVKPHAQQRRTP